MSLIIYSHQSGHWLQSDFLSCFVSYCVIHYMHMLISQDGWSFSYVLCLKQWTLILWLENLWKMINDCRGGFCVSSGTHLRFFKVAFAVDKIERTLYVFTLWRMKAVLLWADTKILYFHTVPFLLRCVAVCVRVYLIYIYLPCFLKWFYFSICALCEMSELNTLRIIPVKVQ